MTHHVQRPATVVARTVTPATLDEALQWMSRPGTKPVAGGTDLMIELERGQHPGLGILIDLTRIDGLDRIDESNGVISIGPLVTHNQCVASDLLRRMAPALTQASWEVGSPQLRNRATIAGNIVTASPANDTLSALVALDAVLHLSSAARGRRSIPISEFHLGVRRTALADDELLTAIEFEGVGERDRSIYLKLGLRRAQAISVVHLAIVARFDGDDGPGAAVERIRVALGSVAPTIVRATGTEALLTGRPLDDHNIAAAAEAAAGSVEPIDDLRAPARYRTQMVAEMVRRGLAAVRDGLAVVPERPPMLWGDSAGRWPTGPEYAADHGADSPISAVVNGRPVAGPGVGSSLLNWLRVNGATGVKEGCAEGECGSCTVHLDGLAVLACLVPATRANGATVTTIEGLATGAAGGAAGAGHDSADRPLAGLHPLQRAFIETGAVQCGFCIPGFLMSGAKLLEEFPRPTDAQITAGLSGNLCRCTGYYKIEQALRVAMVADREEPS